MDTPMAEDLIFCLNADNDSTKANKNFYPTINADIKAFESSVVNGDYYQVNFNVKIDGSFGTNVLSNQSAIAKQGTALGKAIQRVLEITGKDKVVLVGHSMGGLCSREYIQNNSNWQTDGQHHVAKLLTVGTPHGGSNASDSGLGVFGGIDTRSEAIRDLKTTYYYSGDAGRFLFGGLEVNNSNNMNEHLTGADFYNYDVNCNGVIGEDVQGLNEKPIDNLVDFANVIGRITGGTTDGVVAEPSSNMNHYYPTLTYPAPLFYYNSGFDFIENHTELPGYYYQIMQGLDEPNFKELAYQIEINKPYNGYATVQANSSNADTDFYKLSISESMNANVVVSSFGSGTGAILDSTGALVGVTENSVSGSINFARSLSSGTYFLRLITNSPTSSSYQTPYTFTVNTTLAIANNELDTFKYYPNPVTSILNLEHVTFENISISNMVGQKIAELKGDGSLSQNHSIDMSSYEKGIYLITIENGRESKTLKISKE